MSVVAIAVVAEQPNTEPQSWFVIVDHPVKSANHPARVVTIVGPELADSNLAVGDLMSAGLAMLRTSISMW